MKPVEPGSPKPIHAPQEKGELEFSKVEGGAAAEIEPPPSTKELPITSVQPAKSSEPLERSYEQVVKDMRQASSAALLEPDCDIVQVQTEISNSFGLLMGELAKKAEAKLGPPPTPYAIVGLGSLSRNEASPYSDLDFAILIRDDSEQTRAYFQKLNTEMSQLVLGLKESQIATRGIAYCVGGLNPPYIAKGQKLGSVALLDTPKKLALWSGPDLPEDFDRRANQASFLALTVATLQISLLCGDESLVQECKMEQRKILDGAIPEDHKTESQGHLTAVRQQKALKFMANKEVLKLGATGTNFDLKRKIVRPIQEMVGLLSLFYGIEEQNTLKAIDELTLKKIIDPEIGAAMKNIYQLAFKIRAKAHLHYKKEIDTVELKEAGIEGVIDKSEVIKIMDIIPIIDDIKGKMKIFENSSGKINPFSSKI